MQSVKLSHFYILNIYIRCKNYEVRAMIHPFMHDHHHHGRPFLRPLGGPANITVNNNIFVGSGYNVGHTHGTFLGGFGCGLGQGIGQFLMGGLNMFGGWLGGGMNMFGMGGFPMGGFGGFGMGFPMMNMFGMGGVNPSYTPSTSSSCNCGCNGTSNSSKSSKSSSTKDCKDNDIDDIQKYETDYDNLKDTAKTPNPTRETAKNLYDEVAAKLNNLDGVHDDDNKFRLNRIKKGLEAMAVTNSWGDLSKDDTPANGTPANGTPAEKKENEGKPVEDDKTVNNQKPNVVSKADGAEIPKNVEKLANDEITINGQNTKITDIKNLADISGLTPDEISALSQDKAIAVLNQLGYVEKDSSNQPVAGKISANYKVLLLLEKSKLEVNVAENSNSNDKKIYGKIKNVDETVGYVAYDIDCSAKTNGQLYGLTYHVLQLEDDLFVIDYKEGTPVEDTTLYHKEQEYKFTGEKQPLQRNGAPVISETKGTGYEEII